MSSFRCVGIIFFSLAASFALGVSGEQVVVQRDAVYCPDARPAGGLATDLSQPSGATVECATPIIASYDPAVVTVDNCGLGCAASFSVEPSGAGRYDPATTKISLQRQLGTIWIPEDSILAPLPTPPWTLTCDFDKHYTDGNHVFRVVLRCEEYSADMPSPSVTVVADRGVPVEPTTWGRIKGLYGN